MSSATFFGSGNTDSSIGLRNRFAGTRIKAQKPQNTAKRSITGIGASAIRNRPAESVMMPSVPGAIITPSAISAAFRRSPIS